MQALQWQHLYVRLPGKYNKSPMPGKNIVYLQMGMLMYHTSQILMYGGNVLDAYGWVNVICPAGLPSHAVVGVRSPDTLMFVALYCNNVESSANFYANPRFIKRDNPYAQPNNGKGQFESPQPRGSTYISPLANSMGILLLPREKEGGGFFSYGVWKVLVPDLVLRSLNVVYAPTMGTVDGGEATTMSIMDPLYVPILFVSQVAFMRELKATGIPSLLP
jgi:hypothetical protein